MKYILTLTFVLLAALHSKAQELRIVKDNVNCSYGLKNAKGNWVFEPVYTLIQEYQSGYFLVKDVLGDGLLSPNGSWVIECKYDRLYPIKPTWTINSSYQQERYVHPKNLGFFFMGEIGNQRFLINSKGKQLVKLSPSQTLTFDGDAHFFISEKGPSRTSYFDTTGRVLIDKAEGVIAPFGEFDFSLIGNGSERHSNVVYGNVRLISRNGKYPLSEEFDRAILVNGTRICFDQDLKYGELKTDGTVLIAPEYSRKERLSSSLHIKQNWVIYTESDKVGLMKPDGTILLDTLYDEIRLADRYRDFERLWYVRKGGLVGLTDTNGKTILPVQYDEISFVHEKTSREDEIQTNFIVKKEGEFAYVRRSKSSIPFQWYDEIKLIDDRAGYTGDRSDLKLITRRKGKYGILSIDGSVLKECTFENHAASQTITGVHFFWNGLDVTQYNFLTEDGEPKKWEVELKIGRTVLFSDTRSFITGTLSDDGKKIRALDTRHRRRDMIGNLILIDQPETGALEVYNIKTKKKVELNSVGNITRFDNERFLLETRERRFGIIDKNGKVLIKPIYLNFKRNSQSTSLWALLDQKENKEEQWILIDERGKIILSDPVSTTFAVNSGGLIMTENGKIGVFDTDKLTWGIAPIYPCLFESARGFYIAAFSESKKGILRANGTVLLPLEYESIHIFTNEERERDGVTPKKIPQIRWLAKKQQNEILVSQNGDITTSVQEIRLFKESLLFRDTILFDPFRNRLPEAPSMEELRSNNRNNGMSQPIYSIFERSRDHSRSMIHSFPSFDYSNLLIETSDSTQDRVRAARRSFWLNSELKNVVFDSLDLIWKQGLNPCEVNSRNIGAFSNVKSEENLIQEFLQDCECSKHGHVRRVHLWGQGRRYYRLDTIGENFVSITTGYHEAMDVRFQAMSQLPPPPPPAVHLNFIYKEGRAEMMLLRDIFPSDSVLLDEFILALQKRDDLQLECSSLEMMIQMIGGRFSLSDKGIHLYYSNGYDYWSNSVIEFLIPLDRLQLYAESKWIIPILKAS